MDYKKRYTLDLTTTTLLMHALKEKISRELTEWSVKYNDALAEDLYTAMLDAATDEIKTHRR